MVKTLLYNKFSLYLFCFSISIVTYGFALTNYSLTIDSESPIYPDFAMALGRWGTNLIRYHIFAGLLPYFTLLLGLFFLSLSAVELSKIFRFNGVYSFLFCALFLTLPQHAYQLAFTLQADAIPIGFFCAILGVGLFTEYFEGPRQKLSFLKLVAASLLVMFSIAIYQALIFIPVVTYMIYFFINIYKSDYTFKSELIKMAGFALLILTAAISYLISVKLLCPPVEGGYLSSYTAGQSHNRFVDFYNLWIDNLRGDFFYGDKTFVFASLSAVILIYFFLVQRKHFLIKSLCVIAMLLVPFVISFFITNGANPPRLYVAAPIVFGFLITFLLKTIKPGNLYRVSFVISLLILTNIYFITNLFYSTHQIFNHDLNLAKKIDTTIQSRYPEFNPNIHYVYFYGALPEKNHANFKLPNSDVFGGSLFQWDGGNNWRILNFFRVTDVAHYKFMSDKESFDKVKDSIEAMPVWPKIESVKKINNVVVVKLGKTEGAKLPFQ